MGIEPTSKAWEAFILPMNYARIVTSHTGYLMIIACFIVFCNAPRITFLFYVIFPIRHVSIPFQFASALKQKQRLIVKSS